MAKEKQTAPAEDDGATRAINQDLSRWISDVEERLKKIFVSDTSLQLRCRNTVMIRESLANSSGREDMTQFDMVMIAVKESEQKPSPDQQAKIDQMVEGEKTVRRNLSSYLGRPEHLPWGAFPGDKYGNYSKTGGDGSRAGLGPYWSHVVFCGDQMTAMGIMRQRVKSAIRLAIDNPLRQRKADIVASGL